MNRHHLAILSLTSLPLAAHAIDSTSRSFLYPNQGAYAKAGAEYSRWSGDGSSSNLYGGFVAAGLNFCESDLGYHQVEFELGGLGGSYTETATVGSTTGTAKIDTFALPVLGSYNYAFKITDKAHAYLGASAGIVYVRQTSDQLTVSGMGTLNGDLKADGVAPAAGINLGIYFEISKHLGLDVGYKYLRVFSYDRDISFRSGGTAVNTSDKPGDINSHNLQISLSYRF